jgi:hypothetical protein
VITHGNAVLCGHCGLYHGVGGMCPRIKSIEYYENGTVKRVEYHSAGWFSSTDTFNSPARNDIDSKIR